MIDEQFQRQMEGLRRRFRPWEIPAVVRALQDERRRSLSLLRERHDAERFGEHEGRKRRCPPPRASP